MQQDENGEFQIDFTTLVDELELEKLPQEEQESIFDDVLAALRMRVYMRIFDAMPEEQQGQARILVDVDPEDAYAMAMDSIPKEQLAQMFQEELGAIKEEMKKAIAEEGQSQDQES